MEWLDYSPDWGDAGKRLELLTASGSVVQGTLVLEDAFYDGVGDEFPIWNVRSPSGKVCSIWEFEGWRFA